MTHGTDPLGSSAPSDDPAGTPAKAPTPATPPEPSASPEPPASPEPATPPQPAATPEPAATPVATPAGREATPEPAAAATGSGVPGPATAVTPPGPGRPVMPALPTGRPAATPTPGGPAATPAPGGYPVWPHPLPAAAPTPPTWIQRHWTGPTTLFGAALPIGVLLAGLAAAAFVPLGSSGVGWLLAGLATAAVVALLARRGPGVDRSTRLARTGWGLASLALLAVPAVRNAWWLVLFSIIGAVGCATLAVTTGRRTRSILFGLIAVPMASLRGLPWLRRHMSELTAGRGRSIPRVLASAMVTVAILGLFGGLLASADAAFAEVLRRIIPDTTTPDLFPLVFLFVAGSLGVLGAAYLLAAPPDLTTLEPARTGGRFGRTEWLLPVGALVVLFAGFVAVQLAVLFGGSRHVLRTTGLTYAEYARSGFWQLATVTALTLVVIAAVGRTARRDAPADRLWLRIGLGLLCALSVVIVASALFRMTTYQQAYSFTGERIFVMAFELLLGSVFVMVMIAGYRLDGRWIPRATIALTVVMLLALAVLNPEGYAAERNVARYDATGKIDLWYLRALSADATPALATLPPTVRACPLSIIRTELDEPEPWYAWNLGRQRARQVLADVHDTGAHPCAGADRYDYGQPGERGSGD